MPSIEHDSQRSGPGAISPAALPASAADGLYVHVPFCFHKCHYCDFYSLAGQGEQRMRRFVDLLLAEADLWTRSRGPRVRPRTVFFGGGTPTLLPAESMRALLSGLRRRFDLAGVEEWTIEANPATTSAAYCAMLIEQGVTRLSFGAQSFRPAELSVLERWHNPDDVAASVATARAAGFERLNVDLIYAIPGQDVASFAWSLDCAVALGVEHLSAYNLTYEPNTPLTIKRRLGQIVPADEDTELEMLRHARRRLAQAGYRAYEISNYARPGAECRHNLLYWTGGSYIGLGPSAASHLAGTRFRNTPHLGQWEQAIESGALPAGDIEQLTPLRRAGELAMLQLRLADGIAFDGFAKQAGLDARALWGELLERLARIGLIEVDSHGFRLTERGVDVADAVAAEFLQG